MVMHVNLPASEIHEAKQIVGALPADAGKVITPSAVEGIGELRKLLSKEINWGATLATTDSKKTLFPSDTVAGDLVFRQVTFQDLDFTDFCVPADASKTLMPSATVSGTMELRRVMSADIDRSDDIAFNVIGTAKTTYAATAAVDPTFNTLSDYVQYPFVVTVPKLQGATWDDATKTLTIGPDSPTQTLLISVSCAISSSANNTALAFAVELNGVLAPQRFTLYGKTAGDWAIGTRFRELTVHPGDTLQLRLASSITATLTQQDMSMALTRVMIE